jgi:hypothetical protein
MPPRSGWLGCRVGRQDRNLASFAGLVRGAPSKPSRGVLVSLVSPNLVMDVTRARTVITGFAVTADTGLGPGGHRDDFLLSGRCDVRAIVGC